MHVHVLVGMVVSTLFLQAVIGEQCPPWFISDNSSGLSPQCICGQYLPFMIECVQKDYTSSLMLGHCAFRISNSSDTMVTQCPYVFPEHLFDGFSISLPQRIDELNTFFVPIWIVKWVRVCAVVV